MNIIKNNPFRILGLPANSSLRKLTKRITIIKKFATIGKEKDYEYDFLFFGDFSRTVDTVQEASNSIEQMPKKIQNALFWFTNINRIDETALNYLKDNDVEKAIEIWQKTLKNEITEKNYSSYANLSTLLIGVASVNGSVKKDLLRQGLELKGKLLNSNNIKDFVSTISGNGHICNTEKLNSEFTTEILQLVNPYLKNNDLTQKEIASYFSEFPANIQKLVTAKFSETHIFNIEKNIENTKTKRNENPINAEEFGENLFKSTKKDIKKLKQIFGDNNIQFQMIANKLANEILQCSIDFFNFYNDDNIGFDPVEDALKVAEYANAVGATGQVKNRIEENIETLNKIKLQDCFQIVLVLQHLKKTYKEVEEQNSDIFSNSRMGINKEKVKEIINSTATIDIVQKIAQSDNIELINEFYDLIKFVNKRLNYNYISEIKIALKNNLPKNNLIKKELTEEFDEIEKEKRKLEEQRKLEAIEEDRIKKIKEAERKIEEEQKRKEEEKEEEELRRKEETEKMTEILIFVFSILFGGLLLFLMIGGGGAFVGGMLLGLYIGGIIVRIYRKIQNIKK